jgi:hypothetical protein
MMTRSRNNSRVARLHLMQTSWVRDMFLAMLLVAVCLQGFIAQTHVHSHAIARPLALGMQVLPAAASSLPSDWQAPPVPESDKACTLCLVAAHAPVLGAMLAVLQLLLASCSCPRPIQRPQITTSHLLPYTSRQRGPPLP